MAKYCVWIEIVLVINLLWLGKLLLLFIIPQKRLHLSLPPSNLLFLWGRFLTNKLSFCKSYSTLENVCKKKTIPYSKCPPVLQLVTTVCWVVSHSFGIGLQEIILKSKTTCWTTLVWRLASNIENLVRTHL